MSRAADTIQVGTFTATDTAAVGTGIPGSVVDSFFQIASGTAYWGDATSQPFSMVPGQTLGLAVNNPSQIYWKTASGAAVVVWYVRK